ncbi:Fpg/Nei family DNA glycosylase [Acidobacteria bacterium AB60]|nr:Fpg/Nei family DNA glycosylase [Acidobacteria bacterium AB60]
MPEGDTIFRTARTLNRALAGKPVTGFRSTYPLLTRFHDDNPLTGRTIESVESRGKWVLIHFSGAATLVTHMLMNGSWHIYRPGERWQRPSSTARIVLESPDFVAVAFDVPLAEMHSARSLARDRRIPQPAGDLLNTTFDTDAAIERILAEPSEELGNVLLRQRVLAGIGNVFKSEACFAVGLNPFRKIGTLSRDQIAAVVAVAQKQLASNVLEDSPDTIVTYRGVGRRTTNQANPSANLWVYNRTGQPCRNCGALIQARKQGPDARFTFWCPRCQPMPGEEMIAG